VIVVPQAIAGACELYGLKARGYLEALSHCLVGGKTQIIRLQQHALEPNGCIIP